MGTLAGVTMLRLSLIIQGIRLDRSLATKSFGSFLPSLIDLRLLAGLSVVICGLVTPSIEASASTYPLSYSGRIVDDKGEPLAGPVTLEVSFFNAQENGTLLGNSPYTKSNVTLIDGIFQFILDLPTGDASSIFSGPDDAVWIQVKDVTSNKTYPRQQFSVMPFALRVPVDNTTIGYDAATGQLKILSVPPNGVTGVTAGTGLTGGGASGTVTLNVDVGTTANKIVRLDATAKLPAVDGSALTSVNAVKLQGQSVSAVAPTTAGQVLKWNGSAWTPGSDDGGVAGAINTGANLGTSVAGTTADIFDTVASSSMNFRRLKEGDGVELTQSTNDVTIAVATGGVGTNQLAVDAVTTNKIANGTIASDDLANNAVTADKLANDAVTSAKIGAGQVDNTDLADASVDSAKLAAGAVTDAKIAGITTAGKVSGSAINAGTIAGSTRFEGSGGISTTGPIETTTGSISGHGNFVVRSTGSATTHLQFNATDNNTFVGFKAPATIATSQIWTLPSAAGADGQVLTTSAANVLSWTTPNAGTITGVTAGTGLTGGGSSGGVSLAVDVGTTTGKIVQVAADNKLPAIDGSNLTSVDAAKLQGQAVSATAPSAQGQVLKWNGSAWAPGSDDGGVAGAVNSGANMGTSGATTADIFDSVASSSMNFRRLKEGNGVDLTQNTSDVTIALAAAGVGSSELANDAVVTAKLANNAVTSAKIGNGEVATSDLADDAVSTAKIANSAVTDAKLAGITTAGKVSGGAITSGTIGGSTSINTTGSLTAAGLTTSGQAGHVFGPYGGGAGNTAELRMQALTGGNYVGFKAPDTIAANQIWTLPSAAGAAGQVLTTSAANVLSWSTPNAGTITGVTAGTGLTGGGSSGGVSLAVDAGTTANKIVQLDGTAKLPAVDGSNLTNLTPSNLSSAVSVAKGGTGATTEAGARTNLGLGSLATMSAITSAEVPDGTIVTADLANLAVTDAKLATITTAGKVSGDAITAGTIGGSTAINTTGAITTTGNLIVNGGNLGIGTTNPLAKFQVNGQAASVVINDSDLDLDFNLGNIHTTTAGPGTVNFSNMIDGASYTVALQNTTAGNYLLNATGVSTWRCSPTCTSNTITSSQGTHTILSLMKMGTTAYVAWIDRF